MQNQDQRDDVNFSDTLSGDDNFTWAEIWRTEAGATERDGFLATLPRFVRTKNNLVPCTLDHLATEQFSLALSRHNMRSMLTACRSERCVDNADGNACWCRYKVNSCENSGTVAVFKQGNHIMRDPNALTPQRPELTDAMKAFIRHQLAEVPTTVPYRLFSVIVAKVDNEELPGPAPYRRQVDNYVRFWRRTNPTDEMARVIDMCDQHLYDEVGMHPEAPTNLVILCDTNIAGGRHVASVGCGSDAAPFRVGLTCYKLFQDYVNVQRAADQTTILHIDSTFKIVNQCYPAMVMGYSDKGGHFFPLAYFCISRRREEDISWCLEFMKRVCFEQFRLDFAPEFVMSDADKAQWNASLAELPTSKVLMCWFHVCQNVFKQARAKGVDPVQTKEFFVDLYDLHYSDERDYETNKQAILAKWDAMSRDSAAFALARHIKTMWVNSFEFGNWQVFHTPTGCAVTNNPLEQYHKTLKINCANPRATPLEMMQSMDRARLAFVSENRVFSDNPKVSTRLYKLYKTLADRRCISSTELPLGRMQTEIRFTVNHKHLPPSAEDRKERLKSVGSVNSRRMQTLGMPSDGWVVSPGQLKCDCLYWWKHGMCPHVIDACAAAGVQCPGIMPRPRRFVSNARRQRPPVRRTNAVRRVQFHTADEASETETIESSQASSCLMTTEENGTPDNSPKQASPASARASDLGESLGAFHPLLNERSNGPSTREASARREPTSAISNGHQADLHDARLSQVTPPTTCVASTSSIQSSSPAAQVPRPIYQIEHGGSSTETEADSQDAVLALELDQRQDVRGSTAERVVDKEHSPLVREMTANVVVPRRSVRRRRQTERARESQQQARKRTRS